jgi:hypothetical protein
MYAEIGATFILRFNKVAPTEANLINLRREILIGAVLNMKEHGRRQKYPNLLLQSPTNTTKEFCRIPNSNNV